MKETKENQKLKASSPLQKGPFYRLPLEDMVLKTAAQFFGEELLPFLGFTEKILSIAPTEQVHLEARKMFEDFNYILEGGAWLHLEFESDGITKEDLRRFREYEATTSRTYQVAVITCVICSASPPFSCCQLTEGINTYQVIPLRLKDWDGDDVLNKAKRKIYKGETLTRSDLVPVLLTPLMSGLQSVKDRIMAGIQIVRHASDSLKKEDSIKMEAVLYALANKFLDQSDLTHIKEVLAMTLLGEMLINDGIEKGIMKGMELGRLESDIKTIQKLYQKQQSAGQIAGLLEMDEAFILEVINFSRNNPDLTSLQIAKALKEQS